MFDVCTYNAGNASTMKVAADFQRLAKAYPIIGCQEVADRHRELNATGMQVLTGDGSGKGHVALLLGAGAPAKATGWVPCTPATRVGAWGAGPSVIAPKGIRWATVAVDGADVTVGVTHMVPSVQRPAKTPAAKIGLARRRALFKRHIRAIVKWVEFTPGPLVIMADWNATPDFPLLQPLRDAGLTCSTAPSHGARAIDQLWSRGLTANTVEALAGFSSDHKPVAANYEHQEAPMPVPKGFMPGAIIKNIPPGSNDPAITPVGGVLHVAVSEADSLYGYFDGPSGGIESHFYVRRDGTVEQYRSIYFEADANLDGNSFMRGSKRCGLISIETQGMGPGEWTPEQLAALKSIVLWAHAEADVTIQPIPAWDGDGWGYHSMWGAPSHWTPSAGKTCPGPDRIKQYEQILKPWLARGGQDPQPVTHVTKGRALIEQGVAELELANENRKAAHQMAVEIQTALEKGPKA